MKILLIHSEGAHMEKKAVAMASPQEFEGNMVHLDGLVLFAFVSVGWKCTFVGIIERERSSFECLEERWKRCESQGGCHRFLF